MLCSSLGVKPLEEENSCSQKPEFQHTGPKIPAGPLLARSCRNLHCRGARECCAVLRVLWSVLELRVLRVLRMFWSVLELRVLRVLALGMLGAAAPFRLPCVHHSLVRRSQGARTHPPACPPTPKPVDHHLNTSLSRRWHAPLLLPGRAKLPSFHPSTPCRCETYYE